jgi:hypothetical protein
MARFNKKLIYKVGAQRKAALCTTLVKRAFFSGDF